MKRWILLGLAAVFTLAWTLPATASQLEDAQQQMEAAQNKASSLAQKKQQQQRELNKVQSEKKSIISTQQQEKERFDELNKEMTVLNGEIKDIDDSIKEAEDKFNKQKDLLKSRLKVMYENTNSSYTKAIVESENIIEMFSKLKYISMILKRDKQLVEEISAEKVDVEYKKKIKEDEIYKKQKEIGDRKLKINSLQISRAANDQKEKELKAKLDLIERQIDQANEEAEEMNNLIKRLTSKSRAKYEGSMQWPTPGYELVTSPYGWRIHPILGKNKFHSGIDISASMGAAIVAANKGTVVLAGWQSGYGYTVVIDHGGGISTLYAHCSRLLVSDGDEVSAGQTIAKVGSTGMSTGPHLHFEVRKDGDTQDPLDYVSP